MKDYLSSKKKEGKYGLIDKQSVLKVDLPYDLIGNYSPLYAYVKKNGKFGYIDRKGNLIIPLQFDKASDFDFFTNQAVVEKEGELIYIDIKGNFIKKFQ